MRGCNRPYLLWFCRYLTFKFWSRDYHVIMTSPKFFGWPNKCPFYQPFIWGAAIGRICFGSLVIWLLNFDHVTTWSRDFSKFFKPFPGMSPMATYEAYNVNWPYIQLLSHNKAPNMIYVSVICHIMSYVCLYIRRKTPFGLLGSRHLSHRRGERSQGKI